MFFTSSVDGLEVPKPGPELGLTLYLSIDIFLYKAKKILSSVCGLEARKLMKAVLGKPKRDIC